MAEFHPFGIKSGPPDDPSYDPTCFWFPNPACCIGMLEHVEFKEAKRISPPAPVGGVFCTKAACKQKENLLRKKLLRGVDMPGGLDRAASATRLMLLERLHAWLSHVGF